MKKIIDYLNQPYHYEFDVKTILLEITGISLFVFLFLLVFQPFGIHNIQENIKTLIIAGFGIVTFIVLVLNLLLFPKFYPSIYNENRWKIKSEFYSILVILFTIGLGNAIYFGSIGSTNSILSLIARFEIYTLVIGTFPTVIMIVINQNRWLKKNLLTAKEINEKIITKTNKKEKNQTISLIGENEKDKLEIESSDLLFLKSEDNYAEVYWFEKSQIKKYLLRSSLKRMDSILSDYPFLVRCHRSYIVNTKNVCEVKGNSQCLRLIINNTSEEVPVSRKYTKKFREIYF